MSQLANNHSSKRNIIVFHPQCLMSFEIQPFVSVTLSIIEEQTQLYKAKE